MNGTKHDLEELKLATKNNQKSLSDMMQQARETTKLMNQVSQLQAQASVPNQSVFSAQPVIQNQHTQQSRIHSNQFIERNAQGPQQPPKYGGQNNQANRYPPRKSKYSAYCGNTNASNLVTPCAPCPPTILTCAILVQKVLHASNIDKRTFSA